MIELLTRLHLGPWPWNVATTIRFESDWKRRDGANSAVLGIRRHGFPRCGRCPRTDRRARSGPDHGAGRRYQSHRLEIMRGFMREMIPLTLPAGLGSDVAGVVDQVGTGV